MVLLTDLVEDSLDQGYARAAARRASSGSPRRRGQLLVAVGLLAVGLLLATAAEQTRARSASTEQTRAVLAQEIADRQAANDQVEADLARDRTRVTRDRRAALRLTEQGTALEQTLTTLETSTGGADVTGPGFTIELDDAPVDPTGADTDPRTSDDTQGRVTDRDLQTVVNEVWAAGAEAVAINGQRLTALSAIRSAGEAILVDFRPLVPPYEVAAIGPPRLRADLVSGFGGSYLDVLRDYGITYAIDDRVSLDLPASAGVTLRYATSPGVVGSASTGRSDTAKEPT